MSRAVIAGVVALAIVVLLVVCLQKVPLDKVGVVINNFGGGVEQEDRDAGYLWIWPGAQTLVLWDPTVQVIHLDLGPEGDRRVHIRGKDQYTTHLDMTVLFRIARDENGGTTAWRSARKFGSMERLREIVTRNSNKVIWEVMSDLATEDFYNVKVRNAHAERARKTLAAALSEEGVDVLDVLVRKIDYDSSFEARLLEKQLLEQDQLLQSSLAKAEKEKQVTEKIEKETGAMVKKISEERDKQVKTILAEKEKKLREMEGDVALYTMQVNSEAERFETEQIAEGNLLLARARAKGEEAINKAYQQTGGDTLLGKKMVEAIDFGDIEINTNQWNPFDTQSTLRKLMGSGSSR
ncbi:MAG: hypothetical protein AMXMBFR64_42170 [Myxococcales bacterium]